MTPAEPSAETSLAGTVYDGAAGRIGFGADSTPFAGDSFTWVASLTKLVTATCLMRLVERGDVALDEDVRGRVPELGRLQILCGFDGDGAPVLEDNDRPITLRQVSLLKASGFDSRAKAGLKKHAAHAHRRSRL